jgi:hypothetical protein
MIVGCYTIHLYCDTGNAKPGMTDDGKPYSERVHGYEQGFGEFTGHTEGECKRAARRAARRAGWRFGRDGRVYCPRCESGLTSAP